MAICKMCHKVIPDGKDFCDECELKRANQADESYLDRLLSSVSSDSDNVANRKQKKESPEIHNELPSMADLVAGVIAEENKNRENKQYSEEGSFYGDEVPEETTGQPADMQDPSEMVYDTSEIADIPEDIPADMQDETSDMLYDAPEITDIPENIPADIQDDPSDMLYDAPEITDMPEDIPADEAYDAGNDSDMNGADDSNAPFGENPPSEIDSMITDLLSEMPEEDTAADEPMLDPDDIA
ncbi:MAG: hypothetical protein K6E95_09350, partial [Lachnospiraceae bacterium]|nr:hypothetical protein [Lachnospiraceae bacterium]